MDKNKITFKDVAGVEEAKEEVWEIVEFLKDPKKFQQLGGQIPKGVLMVGPPGTGKTLLAQAIAGEADVPFFSISGSDFVEMFVGVGASRVRDMFEQGKKNAPCLIFIDEIDAVGRHRGHGLGGGHDEREQTLNALLVEMDGFDTQEGVIIIAATNRPDVLDPALLRPGRFDRQVTVNLPDVKGREEILKVHAKKVKMADDVDLGGHRPRHARVFRRRAGQRDQRGGAARPRARGLKGDHPGGTRGGPRQGALGQGAPQPGASREKEKENTAYHEAGHAILLELLEHTEPLHKVTIIPRGPSLGSTMWLPEEDKYTHAARTRLLDHLVVDDGRSGRRGDRVRRRDQRRRRRHQAGDQPAPSMVCEWGMSEELGMVEYGDNHEHVFLARDIEPHPRLQRGHRAEDRPRGEAPDRQRLRQGEGTPHDAPLQARGDRQGTPRVRDPRPLPYRGNHGYRKPPEPHRPRQPRLGHRLLPPQATSPRTIPAKTASSPANSPALRPEGSQHCGSAENRDSLPE